VGPSEQYASFFFNQTVATAIKRSRSRRAKRANEHGPVWKQSYKEDSISVFTFLFFLWLQNL
jgi:hypothetical protein